MNFFLSKRFLPLFVTQFLGAFNDNLYKNALVILITFVVAEKAHLNAQLMVTLAAGLFILPFFLFSATAGNLADKYEKSRLIRVIKLAEVLLMAVASFGLYWGNIWLLMVVLFLLGVQASFFGPLKYSILPNHLREEELISGNGMIEAGTFLAILLGTILGGLLILTEHGVLIVSLLLCIVSLIGWLVSFKIPPADAASPTLTIGWNIAAETWQVIQQSRRRSDVFLSIIGISWFWFLGAIFLSQFPNFAKEILHADEGVVTLFLAVFSVGIGIGSLLCNRLLRGKVTGGYAAPAALGMACFTLLLYGATQMADIPPPEAALQTLTDFLRNPTEWAVIASLLLIAICGGVYIVPLYALMQARTDSHESARIIAANNVLNAFFMVLSALLTLGLLACHWSVTDVFLLTGLTNLPIAWLVHKIVRLEQKKLQNISHHHSLQQDADAST
jgi:acyl-[acyl-carrier-protein]-phospholipid O-acyltransferase/long-chain-fatty-acid--[acyl-carrier-protein] ligase